MQPEFPRHPPKYRSQFQADFAIPFRRVLKWQLLKLLQRLPFPPAEGYEAFVQKWWQPADFTEQGDTVWWLGHATSLIQLSQTRILTDPIFSPRPTPVQGFGHLRITPPAATIDALPPIDALLISHDHYDHLDVPSIRQLLQRFPDILCIVPLALKPWFTRLGARQVIELGWWDSFPLTGLNITSVPARHWSKRTPLQQNQTLWCGWVIQSDQHTVYFAGDTGYCPTLHQIGVRFPAIDLALLPVGAYSPRWMMQNQHMNPQEAMRLFQGLQCKQALGIHWATFELTNESVDDPPAQINALYEAGLLPAERFLMRPVGYGHRLSIN